MNRKGRPTKEESAIRNAAMIQYATDNPTATLADIGDRYGVSRQRVERILPPEVAAGREERAPRRRGRYAGWMADAIQQATENPLETLASIGARFGVSRQRVHQVLPLEVVNARRNFAHGRGAEMIRATCRFCGVEMGASSPSKQSAGYECRSDAQCFNRLLWRLRRLEKQAIQVGRMMSNECFNLSQKSGLILSDQTCEGLRDLYREWDRSESVNREKTKAGVM